MGGAVSCLNQSSFRIECSRISFLAWVSRSIYPLFLLPYLDQPPLAQGPLAIDCLVRRRRYLRSAGTPAGRRMAVQRRLGGRSLYALI